MIYLDNASTTQPKFFRSNYFRFWLNSNTSYTLDREQKALEETRNKIKECLNLKSGYILFFRCATEAIEWLSKKFSRYLVCCSPYEHDSVFNVSNFTLVDNIKNTNLVQNKHILFCHQLVNPITGDIWNIKNIKEEYIKKSNQFFGVDITAAIGHIFLPDNLENYCDALWFSGHKFYCEKNIGCMWINDKLFHFLNGKETIQNQYNLVHGTTDVQGACMLADGLQFTINSFNGRDDNDLIMLLSQELKQNKIDAVILRKSTKTNSINAIYLKGINADALQSYLAFKDIYIGTAHSACSDNDDYRVLEAMGYSKDVARQTIRISFGLDNYNKEIVQLVTEIKNFKEMF